MNGELINAVRRVSNIEWDKVGKEEKISNMALIKEYLRRAAVLIKTNSLNVRYPFFDATEALGKEQWVDLVKMCPQLEKINNAFIKRICECYIKWAILVDEKEAIAVQFSDLYEPLIMIFERGGTVGVHHGDIVTGGGALPLPNIDYMFKQEPIDISDYGLDVWEK